MKLEVKYVAEYPDQHQIENTDYHTAKDDDYVAIHGHFGSHGPHVFAAAPELLKALMECVRDMEEGMNVPASAYAAIRKAQGEA